MRTFQYVLIAVIVVALGVNSVAQLGLAMVNTVGEEVYYFWGSVIELLANAVILVALVLLPVSWVLALVARPKSA